MTWPGPIILASSSTRRQQLLESAGWDITVHPAHVDDSHLDSRNVPARAWVAAMAWLKARSVMVQGLAEPLLGGTILSADTVCDLDGDIIGQPPSPDAACEILHRLQGRTHAVTTGVCLLRPDGSRRHIFADTARVTLGDLTDEVIRMYVDTGEWQGKAGGYNLFERLADGWPLEWTGDESTIVGLPMRRLKKLLIGNATPEHRA